MADKICIPLKDCAGHEGSSLHRWQILGQMGDPGAFGEIWSTCCRKDCQYVLKYQKYGKDVSVSGEYSGSVEPDDVTREVRIQTALALKGLAPKVVDSWNCGGGGAIVMMALKETVNSLLHRYQSLEVRESIIKGCIDLIEKTHDAGYYHGDVHLKNIMVGFDPDNKEKTYGKSLTEEQEYETIRYRYYFIDFGLSGDHPNKSRIIADYNSLLGRIVELLTENDTIPLGDSDRMLLAMIREYINPKIKKYGLSMK